MFKNIRRQMIAQRYGWIRIGVVAALSYLRTGVKSEHAHPLNHTCNSDSDTWINLAFERVIAKHKKR